MPWISSDNFADEFIILTYVHELARYSYCTVGALTQLLKYINKIDTGLEAGIHEVPICKDYLFL